MTETSGFEAAYLALAPDRWKRAQADALALLTRQHWLAEKEAGTAQPQVVVAEARGVAQQNVSRAVRRGEQVRADPVRLADAVALARAAGVEVGLLWGAP
ncbi:hypothetical protein [Parafrankia sp. FMc2]|uniref:hypothetical protein n=1 Tax=Parafrankia sp. FMc2 TaxID=3233196 RepID=UPI0034D78354